MPTKLIARNSLAASEYKNNAAGFGVDSSDGRLYVNRGATVGREAIAPTKITRVTTEADVTLTAADDGAVVVIAQNGNTTVTLPATAAALTFTVFIAVPATTAKLHKVSPNASDKIFAKGFTAADDKDAQNTQATAASGDSIKLVGDGVDGWVATLTGTWARES